MKTLQYNGILEFTAKLPSCYAAALMCITMVLFLGGISIHSADADLDTWNSIINSQPDDEACSAATDECGPSKEELKVLQTKKNNENKGALKKQETLVKTPVKSKKKMAQNDIKEDIKNDLKTMETPHSKAALSMVVGGLFGFVFVYFLRKRRKK